MNENWLSQSGLASGENGIPEVHAMPARALMSCSLAVSKEVACLVSKIFNLKMGHKSAFEYNCTPIKFVVNVPECKYLGFS